MPMLDMPLIVIVGLAPATFAKQTRLQSVQDKSCTDSPVKPGNDSYCLAHSEELLNIFSIVQAVLTSAKVS